MLDDGLYQVICDYADELRANDSSITNKEIRYHLYRQATHWIHGTLGKGNRVELPVCDRGEILDLAPEPGGSYVGFQDTKNKN